MSEKKAELRYPELASQVIGLAREVHRKLGHGFTELRLAIILNFGKESLEHERLVR